MPQHTHTHTHTNTHAHTHSFFPVRSLLVQVELYDSLAGPGQPALKALTLKQFLGSHWRLRQHVTQSKRPASAGPAKGSRAVPGSAERAVSPATSPGKVSSPSRPQSAIPGGRSSLGLPVQGSHSSGGGSPKWTLQPQLSRASAPPGGLGLQQVRSASAPPPLELPVDAKVPVATEAVPEDVPPAPPSPVVPVPHPPTVLRYSSIMGTVVRAPAEVATVVAVVAEKSIERFG